MKRSKNMFPTKPNSVHSVCSVVKIIRLVEPQNAQNSQITDDRIKGFAIYTLEVWAR